MEVTAAKESWNPTSNSHIGWMISIKKAVAASVLAENGDGIRSVWKTCRRNVLRKGIILFPIKNEQTGNASKWELSETTERNARS